LTGSSSNNAGCSSTTTHAGCSSTTTHACHIQASVSIF
jgi:hypothetical protein